MHLKADLEQEYPDAQIIPVPVDEKVMQGYAPTKRFNVTFPEKLLEQVDVFRARTGMKRSKLLQEAASAYIENAEI